MKLTLTNRGTGGKRLWQADNGITCLHSSENGIEAMSISHPERSPTLEEIAEARNSIMSEVKSFALVFGPTKKSPKNYTVITLIESQV